MKVLIGSAFLMILIILMDCHETPAMGGRKKLSQKELKEEHVSKAAKYATQQIHKKKLKNAEYDDCIVLAHKLLRGTKQVVAGVKYALEIKVYPILVQNDTCQNKQMTISLVKTIKPEMCEVEILYKPWSDTQMQLLRSVCLKVED